MTTFRTCLVAGIALLTFSVAAHCAAEEPSEREQIEELRREVAELRQAIAELTKRLEGNEYQQLPRLETIAARPSKADVRITPEAPKNLRFPIDIERGSAAPAMLKMRERWLR
jgi:hypothetical protein